MTKNCRKMITFALKERESLKKEKIICQVQLDSSRTCVYWNDEIDLASDSIYDYGKAA